MKTAIVKKSDNSIASHYDGPAKQSKYGGPWGKASEYAHVEYEATLGPYIKAQDDGEGGIEIIANVQPGRDAKLALMREMREPKLKEVDLMINDLVMGDREDTEAVQLYRNQLKNITDNYKDEEDSSQGTDALDNLELDLSDLNWPSKPE